MFNWVKTAMLMAAITALFVVIGSLPRRASRHGHRPRDRSRDEFLLVLVLGQDGPQDVQRARSRRSRRAAVLSDDPRTFDTREPCRCRAST